VACVDGGQLEDVAEECADFFGVIAVNQSVSAGDQGLLLRVARSARCSIIAKNWTLRSFGCESAAPQEQTRAKAVDSPLRMTIGIYA
jgi:hypothetical protein